MQDQVVTDLSGGDQTYIEDCPVCCKPMYVVVDIDDDGTPIVTVESEAGT